MTFTHLHLQKYTCQNFLTQKDPEIENFKPPKSFDHLCHLKSGSQPPPPPGPDTSPRDGYR